MVYVSHKSGQARGETDSILKQLAGHGTDSTRAISPGSQTKPVVGLFGKVAISGNTCTDMPRLIIRAPVEAEVSHFVTLSPGRTISLDRSGTFTVMRVGGRY